MESTLSELLSSSSAVTRKIFFSKQNNTRKIKIEQEKITAEQQIVSCGESALVQVLLWPKMKCSDTRQCYFSDTILKIKKINAAPSHSLRNMTRICIWNFEYVIGKAVTVASDFGYWCLWLGQCQWCFLAVGTIACTFFVRQKKICKLYGISNPLYYIFLHIITIYHCIFRHNVKCTDENVRILVTINSWKKIQLQWQITLPILKVFEYADQVKDTVTLGLYYVSI